MQELMQETELATLQLPSSILLQRFLCPSDKNKLVKLACMSRCMVRIR